MVSSRLKGNQVNPLIAAGRLGILRYGCLPVTAITLAVQVVALLAMPRLAGSSRVSVILDRQPPQELDRPGKMIHQILLILLGESTHSRRSPGIFC